MLRQTLSSVPLSSVPLSSRRRTSLSSSARGFQFGVHHLLVALRPWSLSATSCCGGAGCSSNHAGRSLGVYNYHFQSRGNQGSEGLQGLLQLVLPLCESRNRRAQFMYLIMQALELRLQLLAERLNCATKGPLATGISSTMPPDKLCLRTAASWARSRKSLLYSLFYGRVRQPLDFFTSRACLMRCLLIASKIVNRRTCKK
mgnify:CR=1 FL=1